MGQFGEKTYENDYIEDIIDDFKLDPDFREENPLTIEKINGILENQDEQEVYLGIVSYLIDMWVVPEKFLSNEVLENALKYAENLLKDFYYACRWFHNWNDRVEALEEEMDAIHKLLNPLVPFDFSRYEKVKQEILYDLTRWDDFYEDHQFDLIEFLSRNPRREAFKILKKDIENYKGENEEITTSRKVLAALAISKIEGEDAIDVILENVNGSYSWVKQRTKEYLNQRLINEVDRQTRKSIEDVINNL